MKPWLRFLVTGIFPGLCPVWPLFISPLGIGAQAPKEQPPVKVQILLADRWPVPTPVSKGQTKLTLRGLALDSIEKAEAIPKTGSPIPLKILKKEKSGAPANRDANQGGDSQMELEFPEGMPAVSSLKFHPKTKDTPLVLPWMEAKGGYQMEKEPNGGFVESQPIAPNQLIMGAITPAKDVDVFSLTPPKGSKSMVLDGPKGDHLTLLRPFLMIHTAQGDLVKAFEWETDQQIVVPLPGQATYFLSIIDRLDSTSNFHHYAIRADFR